MIVSEKKTNIKEVCYSDFGHMPFPLVRFKAISDYFFYDDSIIVYFENGNSFETYKVFQYDFCKANAVTLSYAIYEFTNGRKKNFITRIVEWDRNKAKKAISETKENIQLELKSEIHYINNNCSTKMKALLQKTRNYFKKELEFKRTDTVNLSSRVYVNYNGFSKTIQWGAPFAEQEAEIFLDKVVNDICLLVNEVSNDFIPKVEVLFNINPHEYEEILLGLKTHS